MRRCLLEKLIKINCIINTLDNLRYRTLPVRTFITNFQLGADDGRSEGNDLWYVVDL